MRTLNFFYFEILDESTFQVNRDALPARPKEVFVRPMFPENGIVPHRHPAALIPLALGFVIIPLSALLSGLGLMDVKPPPNAVWLALACFGLAVCLRRLSPDDPPRRGFPFRIALFLLLLAGLAFYRNDLLTALAPALPYLRESAPVGYLLFGVLWARTLGMPDRNDFQKFGALLGGLCLIDLVGESLAYHAVPTIRLIGNADVLAGLLLIALCASLKPGENQGGAMEPDQGRPWWRALIMLGLLSCLSRTGLFGAAWIILCFGRGRFRFRALYAAACLATLVLSLLLPTTISDAIRYADYWLWMETVRLFAENPALMLTGFPIGDPLPIRFPVGMSAVWQAATGTSATFGAFLSQVPSFWLRATLGWGVNAPLILLVVLFTLLLRHLTRMGAGLSAALFAQGMITPLFFDPTTGVCAALAFTVALTRPRPPSNVRRESTPDTEPPAAPAESPALRPL